jgi:hypothetical protein
VEFSENTPSKEVKNVKEENVSKCKSCGIDHKQGKNNPENLLY